MNHDSIQKRLVFIIQNIEHPPQQEFEALLNQQTNERLLNQLMYEGVRHGRLIVLKYLISKGGNINLKFSEEGTQEPTLLHLAVAQQDIEIAHFLIEEGAYLDPKPGTRWKLTPLHIAAEIGNLVLVKLLVEKGANLNALDCDDLTPLFLALDEEGSLEIAKFLLDQGADVNAGGLTPLHNVCLKNNIEKTRLLLKYDADPNALSNKFLTPLHYAIESVDDLFSGHAQVADLAEDDDEDELIVEYAYGTELYMMGSKQLAIIKLLLKYGAHINPPSEAKWARTPLHSAIHSNHLTKMLVQEGANVHALDQEKRTPLERAIAELSRSVTIQYLIHVGGADLRLLKQSFLKYLDNGVFNENDEHRIFLCVSCNVDLGIAEDQATFRDFLLSNRYGLLQLGSPYWYQAILAGLETRVAAEDIWKKIPDVTLRNAVETLRMNIKDAYQALGLSIKDVSKGLRVLSYYFNKQRACKTIMEHVPSEFEIFAEVVENIPKKHWKLKYEDKPTQAFHKLPLELLVKILGFAHQSFQIRKFNAELDRNFAPSSNPNLYNEDLFYEIYHKFFTQETRLLKMYHENFYWPDSKQSKTEDESITRFINTPGP